MAGQENPAGARRYSPVFTVAELCAYLSIHRDTLYHLIRRLIPAFRVGSDYRFDRAAIEQWRRSQKFPDSASAPNRGPKRRSG
jgi:excisionase family DNA binding protein